MDLKKIIRLEEDGISFSVNVERLSRLAERKDIAFASELKRTDAQMVAFVGAGRIPELEQGYYVDRQGAKWVLLVGLKSDKIQDHINGMCPTHMRYLAVMGTDICKLELNLRPYLRELCLIDNPKLHTLSGLEDLIGLQKLKIHLDLRDVELNLSGMRDLEELDLRGTELCGIRLDDPLKYLKKCDLRGAKIEDQSFLDCCPALEQRTISDDCTQLLPQKVEQVVRNTCSNDAPVQYELKLLDAIRKSCLNIQAEPDYYLRKGENGRGMEDKRNRRIRDDLKLLKYQVEDQTQRGLSGAGRGVGELDLLLYNDRKEPWTIIEALRVSSGTKTEWNEHLDKLVSNYNYFGAPCVYLLTYVDSTVADFQRIWETYQHHIPKINPGEFTYCDKSLTIQDEYSGPRYIKTAICCYDCGGQMTTAYHIFARVPRLEEKHKTITTSLNTRGEFK